MSVLKELKHLDRKAKTLFWTGQIMGILFSLFYLPFVGGNIIGELNQGILTFREDWRALIFLLSLVGIAAGLVFTWFRSKTGAFLMIACIILGSISIVNYNSMAPLVYIPLLIPGILLLWFAYMKKENQRA